MSTRLIKRNQRVEYIASHCPSLTGKFGTVVNPGDRDGWIHVQFEGQSFPSKCDPSSLRLVEKIGYSDFHVENGFACVGMISDNRVERN